MKYKEHIKSLDGIRGIAVLLVMLFHFKAPWFSLGFIGVPIFFCLSGFLITNILLNKKCNTLGEYLITFFINRSLRIFPVFYLYLLVNFVISLLVGWPTHGYMWFVLYLQNYYIGVNGVVPGILGHTWSLAIEEQFYWFWPFIVFFVKDKNLIKIFIPLVIASCLFRYFIYFVAEQKFMINVALMSCVDMLVMGAIFAKIKDDINSILIAKVVFIIGLLTTVASIVTMPISNFWDAELWAGPRWWFFTSLGLLFSSFIFLCYRAEIDGKSGLIISALRSRFLTYTGKISYGLYMWHTMCYLILMKALKNHISEENHVVIVLVSLIASYLVATASFYWFEAKFLKLKK